MWRPADRILMMAGHTTSYAIEPRGEYVFGVVTEQPMQSRRGRERRVVEPGQLVAWDPSGAHSGESEKPWFSRLMVVEVAALADEDMLANVEFPTPVLSDPGLMTSFVQLHMVMEASALQLERDERLTTWLHTMINGYSTVRRKITSSGGKEFQLACDYLAEYPERNVSLEELAAAAGTTKFRLIKAFRERTGLPPHALQIAHRIRNARRLLEAGHTAAETAAETGFTDQSHLHRHFQRSLGFTPGEYQRLVAAARLPVHQDRREPGGGRRS
jgi:AraC-like DNA-binding protein